MVFNSMKASDIPINRLVLDSLSLPVIRTRDELCDCLRISRSLIYIITSDVYNFRYRIITIPKRGQGNREICIPSYSLKLVQRWVLENILYKLRISDSCYGFLKGVSKPLVKNASVHKFNLYILKMDLKNFFPTISYQRVFSLFRTIGYNNEISSLLTKICTFNGQLPQGAVTSPCIANLICRQLDYRIKKLCSQRDVLFSRYADDLIFSCNNKATLKKMKRTVSKIVVSEKFVENVEKTKLLTPANRKTITGVTITDDGLKAPKKMKKKVRHMIHAAIVTGNYEHVEQIRGYIAYIKSIEENYENKMLCYIKKFYNDDVTLNSKLVESYNRNKIIKKMEDMQCNNIKDLYKFDTYEQGEQRYRYCLKNQMDFAKKQTYC